MKRRVLWSCAVLILAVALGSTTRLTSQDPAPVPKAEPTRPAGPIRVIAIDPGHGGTDPGAAGVGALEKNLALSIGRKLRAALQARMPATILMTRDSDVTLSAEARSGAANNSQADLFVSLHTGYSTNGAESGASIYLMKDAAASPASPAARLPLFLPWYQGYRRSRTASAEVARALREELSKAMPNAQSAVHFAPLAVLSSVTMPAALVEIGNLNDPVSAQTLGDDAFQTLIAEAIASAIERFAAAHPVPAAD